MYPGCFTRSAMTYPADLCLQSQAGSQMFTSQHRQMQQQQQQPPTDADVVEIFDPDFKFMYDMPASAVVHLPPARLNITRLVLCRNYRPYNPQSCAMSGNCKFVHADCDYTKLEAHPIHVNYIWRHESLCTYPRLPAGDVFTVWAPNNKQPATLIPSERILVTKGSQAYMICLQSVRSGLASSAELEQTAPLSHCAHYYFNRMCNRGERCNFIHAVHVDPNVQGDFKRAPGRGQHHSSTGKGKGAVDEASNTNPRIATSTKGGRGGSNANSRGIRAPLTPDGSSKSTRPPSSGSAAVSNEKKGSAPVSAKIRLGAVDNIENSVNASSRSHIRANSNEQHNDKNNIANADALIAVSTNPTTTTTTTSTSRVSATSACLPPQLQVTEEGINKAPVCSVDRSNSGHASQRFDELRSAASPPLTASFSHTVEDVFAQQQQQQQRYVLDTREDTLHEANHSSSVSANTFFSPLRPSDFSIAPATYPHRSLTGYSGNVGVGQPYGAQEMFTPPVGSGNVFTPPQLTWLAPSDIESPYFSRSPQIHSRQQQQQQQFSFQQQQQLPLSPHYPMGLNLSNYDYGSFADSDLFNASHTSNSGNLANAIMNNATAGVANAHMVNVIPRTRRRRDATAGAVVGAALHARIGSVPQQLQGQCLSSMRSHASGSMTPMNPTTIASFYNESSSTTSVQSPTVVASAGGSSIALRSPQGHAVSSDSPYNASLSMHNPAASTPAVNVVSAGHNTPVTRAEGAADGAPVNGPEYRRQSPRGVSSHSSGGRGAGGTVHSPAESFFAFPVVSTRGRGVQTPTEASTSSIPWAAAAEIGGGGNVAYVVGPPAPPLPPARDPIRLTSNEEDEEDADVGDIDGAGDVEGHGEVLGSAPRTSHSTGRLPNQNRSTDGATANTETAQTCAALTHLLPNFRLDRVGHEGNGGDVGAMTVAALQESVTLQSRRSRFRHDPYTAGNVQHHFVNSL